MRAGAATRGRAVPLAFALLPTTAVALLVACTGPYHEARHAPPQIKMTALADARIDSSELGDMRGGIRVNGFDLNIGYILDTVAGGQKLTTTMNLNDNGTLTALGTQLQVIPPTPPSVVAPASPSVVAPTPPAVTPPTPPNVTPPTVQLAAGPATIPPTPATTAAPVQVQITPPAAPNAAPAATTTASQPPAVGPATATEVAKELGVAAAPPLSVQGLGTSNFKASVGSPDTTQIVQQLTGDNLQTVISNRIDGISISQTSTLNVTINNLTQLSARFLAMPAVSALSRELAAFRPR